MDLTHLFVQKAFIAVLFLSALTLIDCADIINFYYEHWKFNDLLEFGIRKVQFSHDHLKILEIFNIKNIDKVKIFISVCMEISRKIQTEDCVDWSKDYLQWIDLLFNVYFLPHFIIRVNS